MGEPLYRQFGFTDPVEPELRWRAGSDPPRTWRCGDRDGGTPDAAGQVSEGAGGGLDDEAGRAQERPRCRRGRRAGRWRGSGRRSGTGRARLGWPAWLTGRLVRRVSGTGPSIGVGNMAMVGQASTGARSKAAASSARHARRWARPASYAAGVTRGPARCARRCRRRGRSGRARRGGGRPASTRGTSPPSRRRWRRPSRAGRPRPPRARCAASAASMAASMAGSTSGSRTRPITGAGAGGRREARARAAPCPAIVPATSRAIGPIVSSDGASGHTPSTGMRPHVVLRPTVPQHADGLRIEPAVSLPMATSTSPVGQRDGVAARAAARDAGGVERVHRRAEVRVDAGAAAGQLVQVRLADDGHVGGPQRRQAGGVDRAAGSAVAASTRQPAVVGVPATSMRSLIATRGPAPGASIRRIQVLTAGRLVRSDQGVRAGIRQGCHTPCAHSPHGHHRRPRRPRGGRRPGPRLRRSAPAPPAPAAAAADERMAVALEQQAAALAQQAAAARGPARAWSASTRSRAAADMAAKLAGEKLGDTMAERHPPARPAHHRLREAGRGAQRAARAAGRRRHAAPPRRRPAARPAASPACEEATASTRALAETTAHLREALASPKARGQWGERMADDVLRLAGMVEGVTYRKQTGIAGGTIPDVTFLLPGGRDLHMDVKFPVDNYLRHLEADTDAERDAARQGLPPRRAGPGEGAVGPRLHRRRRHARRGAAVHPQRERVGLHPRARPAAHRRRPRAEGRAVLAGQPVRRAGRHPPGRRADPAGRAPATRSSSAWPASGSSGPSSPSARRGRASASTPPSAASRTSPARAGASSSASSTASTTSGPAAGLAGAADRRSATARARCSAAPAATCARGASPKPADGRNARYRAPDALDRRPLPPRTATRPGRRAGGGGRGGRRRAADHGRAATSASRPTTSRSPAGTPGVVWATAGVHPHDAKDGIEGLEALLGEPEVVAVGECGLDFHYDHSPRDVQREVFAAQIALAHAHDLALVIHTREAWAGDLRHPRRRGRARRARCSTASPAARRRPAAASTSAPSCPSAGS